MDPYAKFQNQVNYYQYCEEQRENYIDLSLINDAPNTTQLLAKIIFSKPKNDLQQNLTGLLYHDGMEIADLFCMLVELVLYGYDILTNNTNKNLLDIEECTDDILYLIKSYLNSCEFDVVFSEEFMINDIFLYRDRTDYYCEILRKPPPYFCMKGWYVLDYRMLDNKKFVINNDLATYKAFFITKQKRIFTMKFNYAMRTNCS